MKKIAIHMDIWYTENIILSTKKV